MKFKNKPLIKILYTLVYERLNKKYDYIKVNL